jgi:hypothetical protein
MNPSVTVIQLPYSMAWVKTCEAVERFDCRASDRLRGLPYHCAAVLPCRYPENLTLKNMLYFLAVPTLSYQASPRGTTGAITPPRRCARLDSLFTSVL